jgi:hypothetical protein
MKKKKKFGWGHKGRIFFIIIKCPYRPDPPRPLPPLQGGDVVSLPRLGPIRS